MRARPVALLRRLADRLEAAPLSRISEGLAWVASGVEALVRAVERARSGVTSTPDCRLSTGVQ